MKIGIVSDIHADAEALAQVFEEMPDVDEILCAGDAVSEYEFCAETVALLAAHRVHCIQGNHEAVLFGGRNPRYLDKCRQTYPAESLSFLADAPTTREFDFAGVKVLMTHTGLGEDEYIRPGSPRLKAFATMPYDMVCFGHTHVPFVHRAGNVTVINPGSCSQPRPPERTGTYATFDTETRQGVIHRLGERPA